MEIPFRPPPRSRKDSDAPVLSDDALLILLGVFIALLIVFVNSV